MISDIEMPGMNGLSFLEMFADRLPFISSSTKQEFEDVARELGCVDFITKPFSKSGLHNSIDLVYEKLYGKSDKTISRSNNQNYNAYNRQ